MIKKEDIDPELVKELAALIRKEIEKNGDGVKISLDGGKTFLSHAEMRLMMRNNDKDKEQKEALK